MRWFRLYTEIRDDPKMWSLTDLQFRIFINLLCLACEQEKNGSILGHPSAISWSLRCDRRAFDRALKVFIENNILREIDGGYEIINWEKRQVRSDNVAERVARFRARKQRVVTLHETLPVTPQNRTEENNPLNPPFRNVTEPSQNGKVPYAEIRKLWIEILCPPLSVPREQNDTWHKDCRARWTTYEKAQERGLDWCRDFFEKIRMLPWYMGNNDRGWTPTIGWVWQKRNFFKILEQKVQQ